ncbi:hypothetical protein ACH4F6_14990 [Streptomyces sp. NPDC017936]|uniref:hypothetical protein n=1 Tax=Streptomyces sp. NPDC017936 TaxID=3365016 RepID=UPI00378CE285
MGGRKNDSGDRYDRARDATEPGAHSGSEHQAQQRSVPGTASAEEGYQPERGTVAGKPLEGVEAQEDTPREPDDETGAETSDR